MNVQRLLREIIDFVAQLRKADLHSEWTRQGVRQMAAALRDGRNDIYSLLFVRAANTPDKPCVVEKGRVTTYAEFNRSACRFGNALYGHGLRRNDKVIIALGNTTEALIGAAGCAHLGVVMVPCSAAYKAKEIAHVLQHSEARVICMTQEQYERVGAAVFKGRLVVLLEGALPGARGWAEFLSPDASKPKRQPRQRDPDMMVYTSGTTGTPKGAMLNMQKGSALRAFQLILATGFSKQTRFYTACPVYHALPTALIGFTFTMGGTVYLDDKFDAARAWQYFDDAQITSAFMVPTQIVRLLNLGNEVTRTKPRALERILSGGAALPWAIKQRALAEIGPVWDLYGATELGIVTLGDPEGMRKRPGSVGRAVPGVQVKFFDDNGREVSRGERGTLYVKSDQFEFGYYKNDDATQAAMTAGYRTVGDIGYTDNDDYLYVVDRKSDMIVSGGVNIYPAEIERELLEHPAIEDAAVLGIPDAEWGEVVVAFIVKRGALTEADVAAHCASRLSPQKKPKRVEFVAELPRSAQGKILKRQLRAALLL